MEAVVEYCGTPGGAVKALRAGADIAMICHRFERQEGAIKLAYQEIEARKFDEVEWEASGRRIAKLKEQFAGNWSDVFTRHISRETLARMLNEHALLSSQAYAASTALVRNSRKTIPLKPDQSIVLFTPKPESVNLAVDDSSEEGILLTTDNLVRNTAGPSYNAFAKSIAKRSPSTNHIVYQANSTPEQLETHTKGVHAVVFVTRSADRTPWQQKSLSAVFEFCLAGNIPFILISSYTPYDLLGTGSRYTDTTYICTFEFTPPALEAAAAVIFGEREAKGQLPVKLDIA
jgi:beta-N-acetylhexosaminidase